VYFNYKHFFNLPIFGTIKTLEDYLEFKLEICTSLLFLFWEAKAFANDYTNDPNNTN